ncbi:hypothetical protein FYJ43_03585 [Cutibacterium sp. WCA-380-WT-3A]|uniref:Uncharacterized protein n=1 Tax=Cutibacterium porci TaxID=2605781 RepID=A0A7K0J5F7_9ACTN|nr:hypothetical protein [Cutibacterium porci]MSS45147.1 hypothetical protein [Cutibacterium porci]
MGVLQTLRPSEPLDLDQIAILCESGWYDTADSMLRMARASESENPHLVQAAAVTAVARRVLTLDAEDFEEIGDVLPADLRSRLVDAGFPHQPRSVARGALGNLVPLYELMLEVLDIRMHREEPQQVVVACHILGEYLPQLAWQSTLGDGGDPLTLPDKVGEKWGGDGQGCAHTSAMNATARRSLHAALGDEEGYTSYLDKFHSRLGEALGVCAMNHATVDAGERPDVGITCPDPCQWVLSGTREERRALDARVRLARIFQESGLVALRHHAPVGHFFGVPSGSEIGNAWVTTWNKLNEQWADGSNPMLEEAPGYDVDVCDEALPGLSRLVSVIAARPMRAGHLLRDLGATAIAELRAA